MGIPLLAPSLRLLSALHTATGILSHKSPGNVPWRARRGSPIKSWLSHDASEWYHSDRPDASTPCCDREPNDACDAEATASWLQFADWYTWPHIGYFDTPHDLVAKVDALLRNHSRRREISISQKRFFAQEMRRTEGHVSVALRRALGAARSARGEQAALHLSNIYP